MNVNDDKNTILMGFKGFGFLVKNTPHDVLKFSVVPKNNLKPYFGEPISPKKNRENPCLSNFWLIPVKHVKMSLFS